MRIGDLASRAGVSTDTLRLYEKQGLIHADRWPNGYRDFSNGTEDIVKLIRLAQSLGFSLAEIGALMRGMNGRLTQDQVSDLLGAKLAEIDARIAAMQKLRGIVLTRLSEACPLGLGKAADTHSNA
jgi:MerR family transcriptional regulator, copper efflux regulator